jgi:hypothetical protein
VLVAVVPVPGVTQRPAQRRTPTARPPNATAVCADPRRIADSGFFEFALRTTGTTHVPTIPPTVYNLVLATGAPATSDPVLHLVESTGVTHASNVMHDKGRGG